jgi:hypothetical protein
MSKVSIGETDTKIYKIKIIIFMFHIKMANSELFNIKPEGLGWHVTSHIISIAAIVIGACVLAGYLNYRDDSISAISLSDSTTRLVSSTKKMYLDGNNFHDHAVFKQPKNSQIVDIIVISEDALGDDNDLTMIKLGLTHGGEEILAGTAALNPGDFQGNTRVHAPVAAFNTSYDYERDIHVSLYYNADHNQKIISSSDHSVVVEFAMFG